MFDIGFWEIIVLGAVALIVVGPEQMPDLIRTVLGYFRHFQRQLSTIKEDVERELDVDNFHNGEKGLHELLNDDIQTLKDEIIDIKNDYYEQIDDSMESLEEDIVHWDDPDRFDDSDSILPDPELHEASGIDTKPSEPIKAIDDDQNESASPISKKLK